MVGSYKLVDHVSKLLDLWWINRSIPGVINGSRDRPFGSDENSSSPVWIIRFTRFVPKKSKMSQRCTHTAKCYIILLLRARNCFSSFQRDQIRPHFLDPMRDTLHYNWEKLLEHIHEVSMWLLDTLDHINYYQFISQIPIILDTLDTLINCSYLHYVIMKYASGSPMDPCRVTGPWRV